MAAIEWKRAAICLFFLSLQSSPKCQFHREGGQVASATPNFVWNAYDRYYLGTFAAWTNLCTQDGLERTLFYFDRSVTDSWSTTAWRCNKNIILDPPSLGQDDNSLRTTTATFPIWPKRIIIPFVIWLPQRIKLQQDFQVVRPVFANLNLHKYNKNSTRNECACIFLLIANLPLRTNVAQLTF